MAGFDLTTLSSIGPTPAGDFMQSFRILWMRSFIRFVHDYPLYDGDGFVLS